MLKTVDNSSYRGYVVALLDEAGKKQGFGGGPLGARVGN
jgi:hypothetical protein